MSGCGCTIDIEQKNLRMMAMSLSLSVGHDVCSDGSINHGSETVNYQIRWSAGFPIPNSEQMMLILPPIQKRPDSIDPSRVMYKYAENIGSVEAPVTTHMDGHTDTGTHIFRYSFLFWLATYGKYIHFLAVLLKLWWLNPCESPMLSLSKLNLN